jgi:two-component system, cell cycle sensor histidine kinase and response regulator CckA
MYKAEIMVVEDQCIIAMDIKSSLQDIGYTVQAILASGEEAVVQAVEKRPDLVLMDINLRDEMTGLEAAERIRDRCGIPIVFLSAHADAAQVERVKGFKSYGFLVKPVQENELRATIEIALHRHKTEKALREQAKALMAGSVEDAGDLSPEEIRELVQELHTHQIELEMQNEQLRQVQEELLEAHGRVSDLYDFAPVGYVTLSEKGLIIEANLTIAEMLGVERRQLIKQPFSAFIVDEDQDAYYKHRRMVSDKKERQTCELRMRKKEGEPFWAALECVHTEGENGVELRYIVADVTVKRQAQDLAKATAREWETTFDTISDSVAILGKGGLIKRCNEATARILERPMDEIVGHCCWDLVHGTDKPVENCPYVRMTESHHRESEDILQDGKWLRVTVYPIMNDAGEITGAVHIMTDITELKRAAEEKREFEEKIQQAQKLESLGVMAGGIAHDFNNILYAILGNAELAMDAIPKEAVGREHLDEIRMAAKRASELTDQMLAYSGKGALAIENLDLSALVGEMTHLLEVSHAKKAVLKYEFEAGLPAVAGDPSQLRQIAMNLITNASDALADEAGIISVKTGVMESLPENTAYINFNDDVATGPYVYLQVTDTGCGMDEEARKRIFEPFFTTKFTGRGLGMAAVLGIIHAHHGAINIESEPGRGTTMSVFLPALEERAAPPTEEVPQEDDWRGSGTVLVVDDERQVRLLQQLTLEGKGYTVLTAEDGKQAVDVFRENRDDIACVLLDLTMPHMGGEETFVELRQIREDVPVVLVSGYSEKQLKERVENLGFTGFLKKPVQSGELLQKVHSAFKPPAKTKGTETILLVDDDPLDLELTTNLLTPLGYQVLTANSGQAAVDMVREHEGDIDVVLLDVRMPTMDGPTALPLLKNERPEIKVLIFSGYEKNFVAQPLLDAGADGFLKKGEKSEKMGEAIRTALDG